MSKYNSKVGYTSYATADSYECSSIKKFVKPEIVNKIYAFIYDSKATKHINIEENFGTMIFALMSLPQLIDWYYLLYIPHLI